MRQCLFLYYGWFLQNLEKGCIRTNMHTTVEMQYFLHGIICFFFFSFFFVGVSKRYGIEALVLAPQISFCRCNHVNYYLLQKGLYGKGQISTSLLSTDSPLAGLPACLPACLPSGKVTKKSRYSRENQVLLIGIGTISKIEDQTFCQNDICRFPFSEINKSNRTSYCQFLKNTFCKGDFF